MQNLKQPRIIPDVNVILNGAVGKPNSVNRRVYEAFQRGLMKFIVSENWLLEFERVVGYEKVQAFGITPPVVAKTMREILLLGEYIAPVPRLDHTDMSDKKDWYLLDLLVEANADALITQDSKLLAYGRKYDLLIFHPKDMA